VEHWECQNTTLATAMTPRHTIDTGLFKSTPKRRINEDNMNKVILWLLFIIAAACAWEDDYDECSKDVKFNNKHCGEHGNECTGGTSCIDGHCACLNSHDCNGGCVDINCDINHCGACDVKCSPNQICINGVCTCPNNNNACGAACTACPAGQYCDGTGTCICQGSSTACGTGESCSTCVPPQQCINNICSCLYMNNFSPCTSGFKGCRPGAGGESICCAVDGIPPGECTPRFGTIGLNPNCCRNCDNSANGVCCNGPFSTCNVDSDCCPSSICGTTDQPHAGQCCIPSGGNNTDCATGGAFGCCSDVCNGNVCA
jgi:hypothetical protein